MAKLKFTPEECIPRLSLIATLIVIKFVPGKIQYSRLARIYIPMKKNNIFSYLRYFFSGRQKNRTSIAQLSDEEIKLMQLRLKELMAEKKPFLQKGYHIKDMADDLEIPVHRLSAFVNQVLKIRFSDYINWHRIIYCEKLIVSDLANKPDLEQLVHKCGFSNRNSFTAAFKKFTGKKPFEYIKAKHSHMRPGL